MRRGKRIKPRNPKRRAREFARCYHSGERVRWVQALPCLVCGRTPSENAHIEREGMSRKAGYGKIVPLCRTHHRSLDITLGREGFEGLHRIDLAEKARMIELMWQTWNPGELDA